MFKEKESKTPLTGESLLHDLKAGQVTLKTETLGGQQSILIQIIWKNKKYLIILQKDPKIHSYPEAAELCQKLSDPNFQHPSVIKFIPIKAETGKLLIKQLHKMVSKKDFVSSPLYKILKPWYRNKNEIDELKDDIPDAQIKLNYLETINICEVVSGESLEKTFTADNKNIPMTEITEIYLSNSIGHYQSIVEAVLHLNSIHGAHGDISGVNIIVDSMHNYTLIDVSCTIKANKKGVVTDIIGRDLAAPVYLAPEVCVISQEATPIVVGEEPIVVNKIDSWGLAVILVQLLTKISQPNVFNLQKGFPKDSIAYLTEQYRMHFDHKGSPLEIDKTCLSMLPDSKLGNNIKTLLTKALQIDPNNRLSIAEFLLYLNYSSTRLDEIIVNNLSLAIVCNNLSMVEEFFRILRTEKNLLGSGRNNFLNILNAVDNCEDVDVIGFTIQSLIDCESLYSFLSKSSKDDTRIHIRKLADILHRLACAKYTDQPSLLKLMERLQLNYEDSFLASATPPARQHAIKFAIMADNHILLNQNTDVVNRDNIIDFVHLAIKYSITSLRILVIHGFKLFQKQQAFLSFIVARDKNLFEHLLPYVAILEATDINKKDTEGNTLLHLAVQNFSNPTLFVYLVLLGGDFEIKDSRKKDCRSYLEDHKQEKSKIIIQLISLLTSRKSYTLFSSTRFSCKQPDEKTLFPLPFSPESYSSYIENLAKYMREFIITEINFGRTQGARLSLTTPSSSDDFYKISEIILIALQALEKLEQPDDTLTDTVKCLLCLELINPLVPQFPLSPFIKKMGDIYNSLTKPRTVLVHLKEARSFASSLLKSWDDKDGKSLKNLLKKCHCFGPNPLLIRKDDKEDQYAPLDYIVRVLKNKEPWCINIGIEALLKKYADFEDENEDNIYDWYKLTRIECQIIYAIARQKGSDCGTTRTSTNRLVRYLRLIDIDCNDKLTAICQNKNGGFYLSTTDDEYKKVKDLIEPMMERWEKFGEKVMGIFNNTFEIKKLKVLYDIKETASLDSLVTVLRDCVYDALVKADENYVTNLEELTKKVNIPQKLNWIDKLLQNFLKDLSTSNIFTKAAESSSPGLS